MKKLVLSSKRRRNLKSMHPAVNGLLELQKRIANANKGKPEITAAQVKAWIAKGRR
jgi:hypothetical protein